MKQTLNVPQAEESQEEISPAADAAMTAEAMGQFNAIPPYAALNR